MSQWQTGNSMNERLNFQELGVIAATTIRDAGIHNIKADTWAGFFHDPAVVVFAQEDPDVLCVRVKVRSVKNLVPMFGLMVRCSRQDVAAHPQGIQGCVIDAANYLARTPWEICAEAEPTPAVDYRDTNYQTPKGGV